MDKDRGLIFSGLFSHPDRYIEEHINGVLEILDNFLNIISPDFEKSIFVDVSRIIAFSHDIGKTISYFQDYLTGKASTTIYSRHSLLSSIISYHLTSKYLDSTNLNIDLKELLKIISFIVPKRHHSNLKKVENELILEEDSINILNKQLSSIDREKFKKFLSNINKPYKSIFEFSLDEIDINQIAKELLKHRKFLRKQKDLKNYVYLIIFYSLLLDSDKSDVAVKNISQLKTNLSLNPQKMETFIRSLENDTPINNIRREIFYKVYNYPIDLNKKIYTLTLPTGSGKTIHSLTFALKLAEKIKLEKGITPKIIYSLPFLSIIEQNYNVIENILKNAGINITSDVLIKYHHMSDITYKTEDDEFDYWTSRVLVEGFNSSIIVTTFMQFFYSIITNKNKMLRKFHKLLNSIIILDEVQSIPHEYWKLLKEIFIYLTQNFGVYIIFSTATQPLIIEDFVDIISDNKKYFSEFDRYTLNIDIEEKTIVEFKENISLEKNKSYLFVMNTVGSANSLFDSIIQKYPDRNIYYLSTSVTPIERHERIKQIKNEIKNGENPIVVSTQLIEAGIDLDFDVVYRDLAPLDSIVQSAGRCNREGKKEKGQVFVVNLKDERDRFYWSYIYDYFLIFQTEKALTKKSYSEIEVGKLVEDYYRFIKTGKSDDSSNKILEAIITLNFDGENGIHEFKLIKEDFYKEDVFVILDKQAEKVFEEFKKVVAIKDPIYRKEHFDQIKSKFYSYVVQVDTRKNPPPIYNNLIYYVPLENLEEYYDKNKGFIKRGDEYWIL